MKRKEEKKERRQAAIDSMSPSCRINPRITVGIQEIQTARSGASPRELVAI